MCIRMCNKALAFIVACVSCMLVCVGTVKAEDFNTPEMRILVNEKRLLSDVSGQVISGQAYVPIRAVGEALGAEVSWVPAQSTGVITWRNKQYTAQGKLSGSRLMVPLSFIKQTFNIPAEFYESDNIVVIGGKAKTLDGSLNELPQYNGYSKEDLEWLAKIIHAEAKGESYASKLAVGNVILNRKTSGLYPNTIKGVIFDKTYGVQFTPTTNGSIYNTPSQESFLAALEALEGRNNAGNALFFLNPRYAQSSWVSQNRSFAFRMENHDFYN